MSTKLRLGALLAVTIIVGACGGAKATPGAATPGAATPGAGTPVAATPAAGTPAAGTPGAATPAAVTPVPATPGPTEAAFPAGDVAITMWTKEGETDGALQFAKKLAADYKAVHGNVTITVVNKDVEKLREDFLKSSLAGNAPDLLWTVADHIGPFIAADTILSLDDQINAATYLPNALAAVQADGKTWGVPISYGNQLMLYWNKDLVPDGPTDSASMIAAAKANTDEAAGEYGLVYNQTESFWLVPFLGAYDGSVFADDGKTPTLDTEAMKNALTFLSGLKYTEKILPKESDYNAADGLFKQGKAAMIINGDWTLGAYAEAFPDKLGVGPIPTITGAGSPKPYTAGAFYMVGKAVAEDADKLFVVSDFIKWSTSKDAQLQMVDALRRLPGNNEAINDAKVTSDELLAGAAEAVKLGVPQPTNLEMRCVFDSMNAGIRDIYGKNADPAAVAAAMQASAEDGVAPGGECGPA
jgi:arabinogalactan oligomer/maltooligosaccharide transport system substrate-binding protein